MLKEDLNWVNGLVGLRLDDGRIVSIISEARQQSLDAARAVSDAYNGWIDVQADDVSWEVAVFSDFGESIELDEWYDYAVDDGTGYTVYGYVPFDTVLEYVSRYNPVALQVDADGFAL